MRIFREAGVEVESSGVRPEDATRVRANLAGVRTIVAIAGAKGGVGKSVITVNIAAALALAGRKVGILDADLNSPVILSMFGMKPPRRRMALEGVEPGAGPLGLRLAASNLLPGGETPPVSFLDEEPAPAGSSNGHLPVELSYGDALLRLLAQTGFGPLDLLLIDLAPGLEQLYRIAKLAPLNGAIIVTQSSEMSVRSAKAAIETCVHCPIRVIGLVENMVGFNCDGCHSVRPLMPQGDLAAVARETGVPVLARLPFDPRLAESSDRGVIFVREHAESPLGRILTALAHAVDQVPAGRNHSETLPPA